MRDKGSVDTPGVIQNTNISGLSANNAQTGGNRRMTNLELKLKLVKDRGHRSGRMGDYPLTYPTAVNKVVRDQVDVRLMFLPIKFHFIKSDSAFCLFV